MKDHPHMYLVVCVEREEPQMLPEQKQQHPEDEDECFRHLVIFVYLGLKIFLILICNK